MSRSRSSGFACLLRRDFGRGLAQAESEKWGGMIHPFPPPPPTLPSELRVQSPRSRGRENPSRLRVGCCCCCLSPEFGACLPALVCAPTHPLLLPLLASSQHLPRAFPEAFGLFSSPQKQLERPHLWALGKMVVCHGYSVPLPASLVAFFFPTPRQRLSIPPKAVPPSLHALKCTEALRLGAKVPRSLSASRSSSFSVWLGFRQAPGTLVE